MAGGLKKTMIYLGLADGDAYDERLEAGEPAGRHDAGRREPVEARRAAAPDTDPVLEPEHEAAPAPVAAHGSSAAAPVEREPAPARPTRADLDGEGYRAPVTPIKRAAASSAEGASVRTLSTVHPRSYDDAKAIGESFRAGMPVIMNVTELGENEAKRLVDFAAGLVFGLHGSIARITSKVFLLTPSNVEVVGQDGAPGSGDDALYDND